MRIAIGNWSSHRVGGIETYLSTAIPALVRAGHKIAFWHEVDGPKERERICLPDSAPSWCVAELGAEQSLNGLRAWRPDIIYSHKVEDPHLEASTIAIAPAVYFAHDHQGMCISGLRTHRFPVIKPCHRNFDQKCLVNYFPRRCGGLNPVTMLKLYSLQSKRQKLLTKYRAIVTHSEHMLEELVKHGVPKQRVSLIPFLIGDTESTLPCDARIDKADDHLIFIGRMELPKGPQILLNALPGILKKLRRPVRLTLVGDGRMRLRLEQRARDLQARYDSVTIHFTGWLTRNQINNLLDDSDLLVVPSLWPEPFGLVGPEAGLRGVPAAAFDVGGISDWLENGVSGYLAPGNPPTSKGLGDAIVRCLIDSTQHAKLRRGALELSQRLSTQNHLKALISVFGTVLGQTMEPAKAAAAAG